LDGGVGTLTVASYNVRAGIGPGDFPVAWWRGVDEPRLLRMGTFLRQQDADLVALQEVALGTVDGVAFDQSALLGQVSGMEHRYAAVHAVALIEPETKRAVGASLWGNAVLSRFPIREAQTFALPTADDDDEVEPPSSDHELRGVRFRDAPPGMREWRCALICEVEIGNQRLHFISTHLAHMGAGQRFSQARRLGQLVAGISGPVILAGDLNAPIESPELAPLRDSLTDSFSAQGTATGDVGRHSCGPYAIDHVLTRGLLPVACRVAREAGDASDHWPVVARLALSAAAAASESPTAEEQA